MLSYLHADPQPIPRIAAPPAERTTGDETGLASLRGVADAIGREVDAEGVLVAWHDGASDPIIAFASGACADNGASAAHALSAASMACTPTSHGGPRGDGVVCMDVDAAHAVTIRVQSTTATVTLTAVWRELGAAGLLRCRDALARVAPFVTAFFRMWDLRADAMKRVRGLAGALDHTDVATVIVDQRGHVLFANTVARDLLAAGDGVRLNGDMLAATRLNETMRLQTALAHVCADRETGSEANPAPVIALHRTRGRPLLAAVVASEDAHHDMGEGGAVIYLFDPEQDLRPLIEPACKLYRLSPVEARLACMIADGMCLSEAAKVLRVREQTARSYLKQIFLKTDTNRQAELVWLLLKSSVRTSPGCRTAFV